MPIRLILLILLSALITACAPSKILLLPEIQDGVTQLQADEGVVIVRVADATQRTVYPVNYVTFAPKDLHAEEVNKAPRAQAIKEQSRSSSTYVVTLPANEYSITSLRSFYSFGDYWYSKFYNADIKLGTFVIKPGEVTNLGTIALVVRGEGEKYYYNIIRTSELPQASSLIQNNYPELSKSLQNLEKPSTWQGDGLADERFNLYAAAVQNPIAFESEVISTTKGLIFPSRLGTLLIRKELGLWETEALESDVDLLSYTELPGESEIILGEFDTLLTRKPGGGWQPISVPPGKGLLNYVTYNDDGVLYAIRQDEKTVNVYRRAKNTWSQIHTLKPEVGFVKSLDKMLGIDVDNISAQNVTRTKNYLFIRVNDELHRMRFSDETFTQLNPGIKISYLQRQDDVLMLIGTAFLSTRYLKSTDFGDTWSNLKGVMHAPPTADGAPEKKPKRPEFSSLPVFLSEDKAYALHTAKKRKDEPYLLQSSDGGKTWDKGPDTPLPKGCYKLMKLEENALSLNCSLSGEFYLSADGGQTWQLDRESIQ